MRAFLKLFEYVFGHIYDMMRGPATTAIYDGVVSNESRHLQPMIDADYSVLVGIRSRQIVYHTRYDRWWVPNQKRMVYEVAAYAPEELKSEFDPRLFTPVTYPLLCNPLLKWSRAPHAYAIQAFLDRLSTSSY